MSTVSITASIDKVWSAVTDAEHLAKWFPQRADLPAVEVGARGIFSLAGHGGDTGASLWRTHH